VVVFFENKVNADALAAALIEFGKCAIHRVCSENFGAGVGRWFFTLAKPGENSVLGVIYSHFYPRRRPGRAFCAE
jgi:hypothetical protein